MAAGLPDSEDVPCSWGLTCQALRTCRGGNFRVLLLMLKPWCISRAVYQVGPTSSYFSLQYEAMMGNRGEGNELLSLVLSTQKHVTINREPVSIN